MRDDLFVAGRWQPAEGEVFESIDPGSGECLHRLRAASAPQVEAAVAAARAALPEWSATPVERRIEVLRAYEAALRADRDAFAEALSRETGKPHWEALTEVDAMLAKVPVSIEMLDLRRAEPRFEMAGAEAGVRYRPIGVMAVLGPFNLPGHLPNGHIVPALLAGNTVVLKPSELTPGVGARLVERMAEAALPAGIVNLVQGGREVGAALVGADDVDGVLFTGSYAGGRAIARSLADRPERLLALEMGGNNPLVVHDAGDLEAAVLHGLLSAFLTSGQRCTCARRLIVPKGRAGDRFVERIAEATGRLRFGLQSDRPECFAGPLISAEAADRLRGAAAELEARGARALVPLRDDPRSPALLHPALLDVTGVGERDDAEHFGPLLQLVRVDDFDGAIEEANRTRFGLSAALLSDDAALFARFAREVRAGIVNWNRQTTGASGRLPFGGVGRSGNHRPAGAWAADYCSDPVATLEAPRLERPATLPPGLAGSSG